MGHYCLITGEMVSFFLHLSVVSPARAAKRILKFLIGLWLWEAKTHVPPSFLPLSGNTRHRDGGEAPGAGAGRPPCTICTASFARLAFCFLVFFHLCLGLSTLSAQYGRMNLDSATTQHGFEIQSTTGQLRD